MDARYYQRELEHLRRLAVEFSAAHPALAPLLSGPSSDPDVERLLEGMAFLTGQLAQKLDESYSIIGERLTALIFPQLLQDIPSCAIMRLTPKPALREPMAVPAGTRINSRETDGVSCVFSTSYPVELHPLALAGAAPLSAPGRPAALRLDFAMNGVTLEQWGGKSIRLHLAGPRTEAVNRLAWLTRNTVGISLESAGGRAALPREYLRPVGFTPEEAILPHPSTAYPGFRLLREYYAFPEKFFFLDVAGLENLPRRGGAFSITLEMPAQPHGDMPAFSRDDFALFATPAINIFPYDTSPIMADQRQSSYLVRANSSRGDAYAPARVLKVSGLKSGRCAGLFSAGDESASGISYAVQRFWRREAQRHDLYLSFLHPPGKGAPEAETFSIEALYSNGNLPERLKIGDLCKPGSNAPALADFANITAPTSPLPAPSGENRLWPMLSHLHMNYRAMGNAEGLRALLAAYLPEAGDALSGAAANKKRVAAVLEARVEEVDRLWRGRVERGCEATITLDESGFSGPGDMYFFSMVLQQFLREYSAINSFTGVTVKDATGRHYFRWKEQQGRYFPL